MKNRIFILLGSNIDKENNIQAAVRYLDECCHVMAVSGVYETCPVGLVDQPTFLNAAVLVESELSANQFRKTVLCRLERRLKRTRTLDKNAPRTIDADMILFNREICDLDEDHHIPDPDLLRYIHVIVPIAELEPSLNHPETGESFLEIAHRLTEDARSKGSDPLTRRYDIDISPGK